MRKLALFLFLSCAVLTADGLPVTIRLSQPSIMEGGHINVVCRVPRNEHNRGLVLGVYNEQNSYWQMDGEASKITFELRVAHISCAAGAAFCSLTLDNGKTRTVVQPFSVAGCDDQ